MKGFLMNLKKQIKRSSEEDWCETNWIRKETYSHLNIIKSGNKQLKMCDWESKRTNKSNWESAVWYNKESNMPHRAVVRETAQRTKARAVYNNSSKAIF